MAKSHILRLLIAAAFVFTTADAGEDFSWIPAINPATCKGSIGECMADGAGGEFEMDSEINRRILATSQYIGYEALKRNHVPCSQRGGSYYGYCKPGAKANPYSRQCTTVTKCARSSN